LFVGTKVGLHLGGKQMKYIEIHEFKVQIHEFRALFFPCKTL